MTTVDSMGNFFKTSTGCRTKRRAISISAILCFSGIIEQDGDRVDTGQIVCVWRLRFNLLHSWRIFHNTGLDVTAMKLANYVKFREEKFGGVLFETRSEKVYALNPTAAAVVREIEAGRDEGDIVRHLTERYRDPDGTIEREAVAFIANLRQMKLVQD